MTKAVLGIIGGSGVYNLPGLKDMCEERIVSPWGEPSDILRIGRMVYVGRSHRTNDAGAEALRHMLEPLGYRLRGVQVDGCLHLKTA